MPKAANPKSKKDPKRTPGLCGAKTKAGTPCKKRAGHGTEHVGEGRCRLHGGASPRAELAGQVTLARREAAVMGVPLDIEPHNAILECIRIAAGEVQYASERIAELDQAEAVGPIVTTLTRPLSYGKEGESKTETAKEIKHEAPALHIWITTRRQAMDRLVQYSAVALKAGVEQRRVELAEQQGQLLAQVIRGILEDLGVSKRPEVPGIVRRHLSLVAAA
jgi:hypothetical protein